MNYKTVQKTTYKEAYELSILIHRHFKENFGNYLSKQSNGTAEKTKGSLQDTSEKGVVGELGKACENGQSNKSRRYHNFKAIDKIRELVLDIEYLNDTNIMPFDFSAGIYVRYKALYKEIHKLNGMLLEAN